MIKRGCPSSSQSHVSQEIEQQGMKKIKKDNVNSNDTQDEKQDIQKLSLYIKDPKMINVLKDRGIVKLLPIQYCTFETLYNGEDIIARDRTGSGKTIAYLLPILLKMKQLGQFKHDGVKFMIIVPTRQLCLQVFREINSLKINDDEFKALPIYGGTDIQAQIHYIGQGIDFLVCTPGRLLDLLEKKYINVKNLTTVCLDQADQMLNLGFAKDIRVIFSFIKKHCDKKIQNILFSATIPLWLKQISQQFQNKDTKIIDLISKTQTQTSQSVSHYSLLCPYNINYEKTIQYLIGKYSNFDGRTLIFSETKQQVTRISRIKLSIPIEQLHGGIQQYKRQQIFQKFKKGILKCIIATNVAARGLDFPNIELVIQMQPPNNTEIYIHRSGRTGRQEHRGNCITFFNEKNQFLIRKIQKQANIQFTRIQASFINNFETPKYSNFSSPLQKYDKKYSKPSQIISKNCNIFVGSLPIQFTQYNLTQLLKKYNISYSSVKILKTPQGISKKCGFINLLPNSLEINKCLQILQNVYVQGQKIMFKIAHK